MKKKLSVLYSLLLTGSLLAACGQIGADAADSGASVRPAALSSSVSEEDTGEIVEILLSDESGDVNITEAGTYRLSGTLSDGQILVSAPEDAKVNLILDGVDITKAGSAAICALSADKLVIAAAAGSENRLVSAGEFVRSGDSGVDAVIFARCDLTLSGEGTLIVVSETGHGIVTKDDLKLKSGSITVRAAKKGLEGKDSVTVEGGVLDVTAGTKGIVSSHDENAEDGIVEILDGSVTVVSEDDSIHAGSSVSISGGTLTLSSGDDGIHADASLAISGGSVTVLKSYEGLEAQVIDISGGTVDLTASDDGINAAGGSDGSGSLGKFGGDPFAVDRDASLSVSGGTLTVDAGGDGLDSNGSLNVSGGVICVSGPTNNGNGALDYGADASVTGGTVIAAGSSGMAENFGSGSTQGSILLSFSAQQAGSTVSIRDESGTVLASFTPAKSYSSVLISTEDLQVGKTYTVTAGSYSETLTLSSTVYGSGSGMGGHGMGGFGTPPGAEGEFGGGAPPEWDGEFGGGAPPEWDGSFGDRGGHGQHSRGGDGSQT